MAKLRKTKKLELSEEERASFRTAQQLQFWRYEYTKRKFWLDFPPDSECYKELEMGYASLCLPLTNGLTPISGSLAQRVVRSEIVRYHNSLSHDPKFIFDDIFDLQELYEIISLTVAFIREHQEQQIARLHDVAFTYGYYFEDLLKIKAAEKILKIVKYENYHLDLEPFLRKNDDTYNICRFNYADKSGKQFFEEETDGVIYIYLNVLNKDLDVDIALEKLPGIIKRAHLPNKASNGSRNGADMQICIAKKNNSMTVDEISRWCKYGIVAYQNWYAPLVNMAKPEVANLLWTVEGVMHEQAPPQARAIGIWMWDLVHIAGESVSNAMEIILQKGKNHIRGASKDLRQFQRDLKHAEDCIKHMQVLSGAQNVPPHGPSGLIK